MKIIIEFEPVCVISGALLRRVHLHSGGKSCSVWSSLSPYWWVLGAGCGRLQFRVVLFTILWQFTTVLFDFLQRLLAVWDFTLCYSQLLAYFVFKCWNKYIETWKHDAISLPDRSKLLFTFLIINCRKLKLGSDDNLASYLAFVFQCFFCIAELTLTTSSPLGPRPFPQLNPYPLHLTGSRKKEVTIIDPRKMTYKIKQALPAVEDQVN